MDYVQIWKNPVNRRNSRLLLKQKLIKEMTEYDKQILGNLENEEDFDRILIKIAGHIRGNIESKGKNILEQTYRRFVYLSSNDDLPELK